MEVEGGVGATLTEGEATHDTPKEDEKHTEGHIPSIGLDT